ncbi:ATP phosphoribosyltransferase regulatory subunit [bacterium]|nr:ATP phosphoribosyltransferase regulatory subunit [bacterium]
MADRAVSPAQIPEGGLCLPPPLALKKRELVRSAEDCLAAAGFSPIELPILEYAPADAGSGAEDRCTFVAPDGKLLMLRYDHTTSLIRFLSSTQDLTMPQRLCYEGLVFRRKKGLGGYAEVAQLGAEILGVAGVEADIEMVRVMIRTLEAVGLTDFLVDIGTVEVFKGIVAGENIDPKVLSEIRAAIMRKDETALKKAVAATGLAAAKKNALLALPGWFGGPDVFATAAKAVDTARSRQGLERLKHLHDALVSEGFAKFLSVDMGVVHSLDYYTGAVFEAYVRHVGAPIAAGGRYDRLADTHGKSIPATGFALNLAPLLGIA